jgi:F0F1-type ATP synthase delta subunit
MLLTQLQAGILEKVESELMAFSHTLDKSPNFAAYLANPTVPRGEKQTMVLTRSMLFFSISDTIYY